MKQRFGCMRYSAGQSGPSSCRGQYSGGTEKSYATLICKHKVREGPDCTWEKNPEKLSLEAVGVLKQATDKEDRYLIYRINNFQFNGQPN